MNNIGRVDFVGCTRRPAQLPPPATMLDKDHIGTYAERLIEFAGRVCYASTDKFGYAPGFIAARIREGHEDILEHAWATVAVETKDWMSAAMLKLEILDASPFMRGEIQQNLKEYRTRLIVTGNLRAWRVTLHTVPMLAAHVVGVAPQVFPAYAQNLTAESYEHWRPEDEIAPWVLPEIPVRGQARVHFLGAHIPYPDDEILGGEHYNAVFLVEGISRACTHQLVRHRLSSISMLSQRYVRLEKSGWEPVIPPSIQANPDALEVMTDFLNSAEIAYTLLRAEGIRAEDARFVLPNATDTRIVVSMDFEAWRHFIWQRALDKAAQWEIRGVGQDILRYLFALAPHRFDKEMDYLIEQQDVMER